jgi:hypothetical protein
LIIFLLSLVEGEIENSMKAFPEEPLLRFAITPFLKVPWNFSKEKDILSQIDLHHEQFCEPMNYQ